MTVPSTSRGPDGRPRTVNAAFYCWIVGAVITAATGMLMLVLPVSAFKVAGIVLMVVGLALGFLAGKARRRDPRFARAAVALAVTAVIFLALVLRLLEPGIVIVALIVIAVVAMIAGAVLNQRPASVAWYAGDGVE